MSENLSEEDIRKLRFRQMKADPRYYMRYRWRHPNRPQDKYDFRTTEGDPINYVADDRGPLNPQEWGSINVLLMARGCLKSTSVLGATTWALDMYPSIEAFMTAPRQDQVQEFVDKFRNAYEDTPLEDKEDKKRQGHHKFGTRLRDERGEAYTSYSHLKTQSAWGEGEGLRAPHTHIGIIDEFQDVDEGSFSVFLEAIDRTIPEVDFFPIIWILGTPKLRNTFFESIWKKSDQRTWEASEPVSEHADPSEYDREEGWWVKQSESDEYGPPGLDRTFNVVGWHIDQPNSPLHEQGAIEFKRDEYSEKRFKNEVLAQFYSPEDDLLTEKAVRATDDEDLGFRNQRVWDDSNMVITVDWGGGQGEDASDTVFNASEWRMEGDQLNCHLRNIKFLDHDIGRNQELNRLRTWINKFSADRVLVDEGYAGTRRETLQEEFDNVHGVGYGNVNPQEDVRWQTDEYDRKIFVTVDKTYVSEAMVEAFKDGRFVLPWDSLEFGTTGSNGTKLVSQLTATYKEFDTTPSGTKKLKIKNDRNDDAFQTFVYQYLGGEHLRSQHTVTNISLNDRV